MCVKTLREEGAELTGLWFNPNIHPFTEYRQRRSTLEEYAKTIALPLLLQDEYGLRGFVAAVGEDFSHRCALCYRLRLFGAARAAKEGGFDNFTSSLFISPYQNHELMKKIAQEAAAAVGVPFLYRDFRPYFKEGQEKAKELGLYRQKYCGCIFSEEERYRKPNRILKDCEAGLARARELRGSLEG